MPTQQVVAPPAQAGMFLVYTVREGAEEAFRDLLADVSGLTRSVGFRIPAANLLCDVGLGSRLWDRMLDAPKPIHLHPLPSFVGATHTAPSTPGDVLVHLRAARMDLCFELARVISAAWSGVADIEMEVHGFSYFDMRDLLGFVDGTENPEGDDALAAALVGDEDPDYAGGSYVITQKYLHDLDAWNALTVEEQERVIGRTKVEDLELPDDVKPANSHVALNTVEDDDGNELQILRDNMPFGRLGEAEFGTFFIGYAADPGITELMLRNMFLGKPEGNHDRILDFSTAVTGGLFFTPPIGFLDEIDSIPVPASTGTDDSAEQTPPAEAALFEAVADAQAESSVPSVAEAASDAGAEQDSDSGSLGIGSLRGR